MASVAAVRMARSSSRAILERASSFDGSRCPRTTATACLERRSDWRLWRSKRSALGSRPALRLVASSTVIVSTTDWLACRGSSSVLSSAVLSDTGAASTGHRRSKGKVMAFETRRTNEPMTQDTGVVSMKDHRSDSQPQPATDPVCGMAVDPATARFESHHDGERYVFCCSGCQAKFEADPDRYLNRRAEDPSLHRKAEEPGEDASAREVSIYVCPMDPEVRQQRPGSCPKCGMALEPETPAASIRTEYTCPMHPEIVRDEPGSCPICGMALEPRTVTLDEEENPELVDMTRRFLFAAVLSAPILLLAMGHMLPGGSGVAAPTAALAGTRRAGAGNSCVSLVGLAVLCPCLAVGREPQPQHVHLDRSGRQRRLSLQRGRGGCSGPLPRLIP